MSNNKKNTSFLKDALILFAITLVAAVLLSFVNEITKGPIAEQKAKKKAEAYQAVYHEAAIVDIEDTSLAAKLESSKALLESASLSKVIIDEAGIAKDEAGIAIGYVMTITTSSGYNGNITITMGFTSDKTITGIQFLTLAETAGLGMKVDEEPFKGQFINKFGEDILMVTITGATDENEINAVSGATISSGAVTEAVNAGIVFGSELLKAGIGGLSYE